MQEPSWQRTLVDRLVADARPVRRLWRPEIRLLLWLGVVLPAILLPAIGVLREDIALRLRTPGFLLEEGAMLVGATLLGLAALRAAVPGRNPGRPTVLVGLGALAVVGVMLLVQPVHHGWTPEIFLDVGLRCLVRSFVWAALPLAVLLVVLRRGAVIAPSRVGALAGVATWGLTFVAVRVCCQTDELLHLTVFHALPVIVGTLATAALAPLVLARWHAR